MAGTRWGHPRRYTDFPDKGEPSEELFMELTRGYAACVSYVDAQIGRVLAELDRLQMTDNTIVVLWGDHGWHVGENHVWGKGTNFEMSARAPLIVAAPEAKAKGAKTKALVEFVDVFPTLCELAGVPLPEHLEGTSCAAVLDEPNRPWKSARSPSFPAVRNLLMPAIQCGRSATGLFGGRRRTMRGRRRRWSFMIMKWIPEKRSIWRIDLSMLN